MAGIAPGTKLQAFADTFRKAISEVCSAALASAWTVAIDESDAPLPPETSWLCFELLVSGGLQGKLAIQIRSTDALLLAQKFLAEPADPAAELKPDHKEALEELLRQITGLVATGLKGTWGETKFEVHASEPPTWDGIWATMLVSEPSAGSQPWKFHLSSDLSATLSAPVAAAPQAPPKAEEKSAGSPSNEPNFDLLLGVNLNLTLRFGQTVMSLREVLDLNSGSVIELDREVHEPADLLLGDKLIARGEVVIVDGNYGIRITEVPDARQRLDTI